jgi:chemotaxis methyl-accepting protein methylase
MDNRSDKTCDLQPATCSDSNQPDTADDSSDPIKKLDIPSLSDKMFSRFSEFVQKELGIKMPEAKKIMLQARLQKRLRKTGITTFEDYYNYVFSPRGREAELASMIDAVTTNKTDFFREPQHFDYLFYTVLPELASRKLRVVPCSQAEIAVSQAQAVSS